MENTIEQTKFLKKTIQLHFLLSTLIILTSLFAAIFQFEALRNICVCISNYLAWSWIAFGITILIGLIANFYLSLNETNNKFLKLFLFLQTISFYLGIIFIVLFGSFLLRVI